MIDSDDPTCDMLESFRNDLRSMHPLARASVHALLDDLAFDLLIDSEWQAIRPPLDHILELIERNGLLHEFGMYRVVRLLADLLWSGPEAVRCDIDDPEVQLLATETSLLVGVLASKAMPEPHLGIDSYRTRI
jgi:hypothetical protein